MRERANGASGKRCDIDAAKRRSQTENWEVRVNRSNPKLGHIKKESQTRKLKNRSRRESNPHLRFRKPPFYPLNYGNGDNCDFRVSTGDCKQPTTIVCERLPPADSSIGIKQNRQLQDGATPRIEAGCDLPRDFRARDCDCVHPILRPDPKIRPTYLRLQ